MRGTSFLCFLNLANSFKNYQMASQRVTETAERVEELGRRQAQIGAIVKTIDELAEQTNLLTLNAAIEAARAGEQGRGFALVAEEVRKLAERSSAATREIATLIESVQESVDGAHQSMKASAEQVQLGSKHGASASAALDQIQSTITQVSQIAKSNNALADRTVTGSESVRGSITSVASVSEETAAGAQEMSASNQEVAASSQTVLRAVLAQVEAIRETRHVAENLAGVAQELRELADGFFYEKVEDSQPKSRLKVAA